MKDKYFDTELLQFISEIKTWNLMDIYLDHIHS
jgi:hypothetical protein